MGVERWKRWQWALLGLVGGVLLAWAWSGVPDQTGVRTFNDVGGRDFRSILRRSDSAGDPMVRGLLVYPESDAFEGQARVRLVTFATKRSRDPDAEFVEQAYYSPVPFPNPTSRRNRRDAEAAPDVEPTEFPSVLDFLAQVAGKGRYEGVTYRTAWWAEPVPAMLAGGTAGVLLLGGVWPTLLNLMTGAGLGRRGRGDPEYDLDRFATGEQPAETPQPAVPDDDDMDAVMARYRSNLADGDTALTDSTAGQATEVRKLDTSASGAVSEKAAPAKPDEPKEYGGDYYPVAKKVRRDE